MYETFEFIYHFIHYCDSIKIKDIEAKNILNIKCPLQPDHLNINGFIKCGVRGQKSINDVMQTGVFCDVYCGWFKRTKRRSYLFCSDLTSTWYTNHLEHLDCLHPEIKIEENQDSAEFYSIDYWMEKLENKAESMYKRLL